MNSIFRRYPKHWFCGTAVLLLLYPLALGPTAWFLWNFKVVSLTQPRLPVPEPPRFLTESVGIAVATWFIWLFVLWMNQRRADRQTVGLVDR